MPFYKDLVLASKVETAIDKLKKEDRTRIIQGLIKLRNGLVKEIPMRTQNESRVMVEIANVWHLFLIPEK